MAWCVPYILIYGPSTHQYSLSVSQSTAQGRLPRTRGFGGSIPQSTASYTSLRRNTLTQSPASRSFYRMCRHLSNLSYRYTAVLQTSSRRRETVPLQGAMGRVSTQSVQGTCARSTVGRVEAAQCQDIGPTFNQSNRPSHPVRTLKQSR